MRTSEEFRRLEMLRDLDILDSPQEPIFDRYVALAADIFKAPVALISLVDADRQWFKARIGLDVCQTDRSVAFCDHAIRSDKTLVVLDATRDQRFQDNPLVIGEPGIRFYAGAPLVVRGHRLGTLCVIDFVAHARFPGVRKLECFAAGVAQAIAVRKTGLDMPDASRIAAEPTRMNETPDFANQVGAWTWDRVSDHMTWSDEVFRIHQRAPTLGEPAMAGLLAAYQPEDAARLTALVNMAMEDRTDAGFQGSLVRLDGARVNVGVARRCDANGSAIGVHGVFRAHVGPN